MKKLTILITIVTLIALLVSNGFVIAAAKDKAPNVSNIEKVAFIHYKAPAKPPWAGTKPPKEDDSGYSLFRGGVKWADTPVEYSINIASIPGNVDAGAAVNEIIAAFETWDNKTSKDLFNYFYMPVTTEKATRDGNNVIAWTEISAPNVIAVTYFWYDKRAKLLLEFDMEINTKYIWGIDTDGEGTGFNLPSDVMDICNIATHEAGHTLVLEDLYQSQYAALTMYGYSDYAEVSKRILEPGDIAGLQALYGN